MTEPTDDAVARSATPLWNSSSIVGGLATIALGVFVLVESLAYGRGTVLRMGPGYFPGLLGTVLTLLGGLLLVSGWRRRGERIAAPELRAPAFIVASLVLFAQVLPRFGLMPAIAASVPLACAASPLSRPLPTLFLTVSLIAFAWLVFVELLSLPLPLAQW